MRNLGIRSTLLAIFVAALFAGAGAAQQSSTVRGTVIGTAGEPVWTERESYLMGTGLRIAVAAPDRERGADAIEAAFGEVRRLEDVLSSWRPDSEVGRINGAAPGTAVPLSAELRALLREVGPWVDQTGGAFDPAIGALVDAWDLRGEGRSPTASELEVARAASGWNRFHLNPRRGAVTRLHAGSWIDTGAFGKGAALRRARRVLAEQGIRSALLDFGGQIVTLGCPREDAIGTLAVAHPVRRDEPAVALRFCDASASTTSDAEQWVEVGGARLGHVLDPRTGRPAPAWGSVTVVAKDPMTADVLSTALFVLGPVDGFAWARNRNEFGALFLWEEGNRIRAKWNPAMAEFLVREPDAGNQSRSR